MKNLTCDKIECIKPYHKSRMWLFYNNFIIQNVITHAHQNETVLHFHFQFHCSPNLQQTKTTTTYHDMIYLDIKIYLRPHVYYHIDDMTCL